MNIKIEPSELREYKKEAFSTYASISGFLLGINGEGQYEVRKGVRRWIKDSAEEAIEKFNQLISQ